MTRAPIAFGRRELASMLAVLVFYAITRLVGLVDFPIFFFCDEAIHANLAGDLVERGFRDAEGNLFPAYFKNARVYNLSLSVWLHVPATLLFGKSIFAVRATSVAIGLLGAAALMLALKIGFESRLWWTGGLVFAALPGWFLHSRTAFETAMMVGFYACFLCAYLLYREVSPRWLPLALVCGAATFYSYTNGQGVMLVTGSLLAITDGRYHLKVLRDHRRVALFAAIAALLLAAPYLRFRFLLHPEMVSRQLEDWNSYWIKEIGFFEKLSIFAGKYLGGLSPFYWFLDDTEELVRHRMRGYGYLPVWLAPFILVGLGLTVRRCLRSAAHRLLLIAIAAAPFSASLVDIRITRVLAMMVPATVLAVLGIEWVGRMVQRVASGTRIATIAAVALVLMASLMTADALRNGATWFDDYGLYGMQWGAKELFGEIRLVADEHPEMRFVVSHNWANYPNAFLPFFLDESARRRVRLGIVRDYVTPTLRPKIGADEWFVLTARDYEEARTHPVLEVGEPLREIPYPDGRRGFVIARLAYAGEADELFEVEVERLGEVVEGSLTLDEEVIRVLHSDFDAGTLESLFDGDVETIARTRDADPCRIIFHFDEPRQLSGVRLDLWRWNYEIEIRLTDTEGNVNELEVRTRFEDGEKILDLALPEPVSRARELSVAIVKLGDNKIHIRELELLP